MRLKGVAEFRSPTKLEPPCGNHCLDTLENRYPVQDVLLVLRSLNGSRTKAKPTPNSGTHQSAVEALSDY